MHFAPGEPESGSILVSFSVATNDYDYLIDAPSINLSSRVPLEDMDASMLILGLRELKSPGILPVKKAYIQFNIKSLVPPNQSAIQNIQT